MSDYPRSPALIPAEAGGVVYYTFPLLSALPGIRHGFSTRLGGVSDGDFASMNLGFLRGDGEDAVRGNYARLCRAMGMDDRQVVLSAQEHHVNLYNAAEADRGRGLYWEKGYEDIDGLLTDRAGVVLCTLYADCVPLFFADPVRRVVATSHAGWKGTAARIGAVTVERMRRDYGCRPEDIRAGIGPSIGPCCFEVDAPVAAVFAAMEENRPESPIVRADPPTRDRPACNHAACVCAAGTSPAAKTSSGKGVTGEVREAVKGESGKFHVDLWETNRRILLASGLRPEHVAVGGLCTRCRPDVFWSHRAAGSRRGSLGAFICLD